VIDPCRCERPSGGETDAALAAVTINEAVEIARRFGSSDSPRFVNGILDRLAKSRQAGA